MEEIIDKLEDAESATGGMCPIDLETAKSRVMGDMGFLREMLEEFSASTGAFMETLGHAIKEEDAELLSRTAHQLKGAALNLSLMHIAEKASQLNEIGRQVSLEQAGCVFAALERTVSEFKEFMQNHRW